MFITPAHIIFFFFWDFGSEYTKVTALFDAGKRNNFFLFGWHELVENDAKTKGTKE